MSVPIGTKATLYDQDGYDCPHCKTFIMVGEVACGKVRCGMYANAQGQEKPIDFHMTDEAVAKLNVVYGCGKIFGIPIERPMPTKRKVFANPRKTKAKEASKILKKTKASQSTQ